MNCNHPGGNGSTPKAERLLRRAVRERLARIGFKKNGKGYHIPDPLTKDTVRKLHGLNRRDALSRSRALIIDRARDLIAHFATGSEVVPARIDPNLVLVRSGTDDAALFRFATLLWSVPVSQGFGRRLRFLVRDRQNGKLIGLFGLTDPVFNLAARDRWIGWTAGDRRERLARVMDAFVVGAVPPYSQLIGGKLVAALMTSSEVMTAYERKYRSLTSVICARRHPSKLVLLTTISALGRSSLYNRLQIPGGASFERLGETSGYGHFHLSGRLFERLRSHLDALDHPYASGHRFGMGPNWRIRVAREALDSIGLDADAILRHTIRREVFAVPLAKNWRQILNGDHVRVRSAPLPAKAIAAYCVSRWMVPRSKRDQRFLDITRESTLAQLAR